MADEVKTPVVRDLSEIKTWDREADVIVVGLGCSGTCAAIEAARAGAQVLAVERAQGGGGTSADSGGLIYMGGGTPVQKACGFEDSPEEMFKFLMAACGPGIDEEKIRLYCEGSVGHFHWLVEQGVPFKNSFYPEPGREPPTNDCLLYSGGEDSHPFQDIARPAPRAHKPQTEGAAGGFLMQKLLAAAARAGVAMETGARSAALVLNDAGGVVGLVARKSGGEQAIRARRGLILAAGGFIKNKEMLAQYAPLLGRCNWPLGVDGDDGWAIRAGMAAGAAAIRMEMGSVSIPLYPPKKLMKGILINGQGQRFINEDAYFGRTGQTALYKQDGNAYLIVDADTYVVNEAGMKAMAVEETVEDLERVLEVPAGGLRATLDFYNRHAERGEDPLFRKSASLVTPLRTPPFAAIGCGIKNAIYAVFTLGGLHTRPGGEVLRPDGAIVPGLYAAGRTACSPCTHGYCSGLSLGDGSFFGRRAGKAAATSSPNNSR